jgi:hypothetical protein
LHGHQRALDVDVEGLVELRFADASERHKFAAARIGEQDVDAACLRRHDLDDTREVGGRCIFAPESS